MINAGTYTITATAGNVSTTATYTINKAELTVKFNEDKTVSVTFEDGTTDASTYVSFKYYQKVRKTGLFGISYTTYEEVSTKPTSGEYYVIVSAANENIKIKDALDIDLSIIGIDLRINGVLHKYN